MRRYILIRYARFGFRFILRDGLLGMRDSDFELGFESEFDSCFEMDLDSEFEPSFELGFDPGFDSGFKLGFEPDFAYH